MLEQDRFASGRQMHCPSCTAENAAARRFCAQCGAPLPSPCPACGFENEPTAKFCGGCGKPIGETAAPAPAVVSAPLRADGAERRQLSVMFCDLVGSTALSARLDPEDLREVIGAYHRAVAEMVAGFDGFVAKYMGDGVLAYFGYPRAHEDDAERAVRAGLRLIAAVGRLDVKSVKLQARVGIATGLVVVGDLIGEGSAQEQSVVGETPNLAARLQALAEPDAVVIAAGTRWLVGDLFEYRDLGAIEVKGIARPVPAWQVLRPSAVASRFEALRGSALTPLVGRDEEIDLLLRRWARAKAGDGQVVLVSGEPGIGKSRLTAALEVRLQTEPHIRLRYFCSPYHQDSALFPFVDQLGRAAGFARDEMPAAKLDKLDALLARAAPPDEDVAFLADLLSLPASDRHPLPNVSPQRKKERTLEALIHQLEGLARQQPVAMIFEDAHWIDPTSHELLDLVVDCVRSLPVLLIMTFRSEFQPPWTGQPQVTMLALNRLDRQERTALVEQIAGSKALPNEVVEQIANRTDGVPLFVEELTKSVLESGLLREEVDRYVLDRALPPFAIPTTLHNSLMARLDRLASVRLVAQIGAAIGREFSYVLLCAVSRLPEDELQSSLHRLVASELVFQRGRPPDAVYTFKHALVQDAAHDSLLRSARQQLHAQIARALEAHSPELIESQPEIFAQHYAEAGLIERAVDYFRKAGERALANSANPEAVQHLKKGIELTRSLPPGFERDRREFCLQATLGPAMRATQGHGAKETLRVFRRARELMDANATPREQMTVLYGIWGVHFVGVDQSVTAAHVVAEQCLALAAQQTDADLSALAVRLMGLTLFAMGEFVEAADYLKRTFEFCPPDRRSIPDLRFAHDHAANALAYLAWSQFVLGYPEKAACAATQAVERAQFTQHAMTIGTILMAKAMLNADFGANLESAEVDAETGLAHAVEHRLPQYEALCRASHGVAFLRAGNPRRALELISAGVALAEEIGAAWGAPMLASYLAVAHAKLGERDVGFALLDQAIARLDKTRECFFEAELHRIKAEILIEGGYSRAGKKALQRALSIAQRQQARQWELRAAVSLARLWGDQNRQAEARDLLAPIYGWFTEGFGTPDLKEAKALLDELG
jgi:class 3 adenylate cyclase/predicted ATPase